MSTDETIRVTDETQIIVICFSFTNGNVVPRSVVPEQTRESPEEGGVRQARGNGVKKISETEKVDGKHLLSELTFSDWTLYNAYWQMRQPRRKDARPYYTVHFEFCRTADAQPTPAVADSIDMIGKAMDKLLHDALWRVRGFVNPYTPGGVEVPGKSAISVNFEARNPWQAAPHQEPAAALYFTGEEIGFEPASELAAAE